jgi:hypothetical protein
MHDPIQDLWLTVLTFGLKDAHKGQQAEAWLWSSDFDQVCELAKTSAEDVRREFYRKADAA